MKWSEFSLEEITVATGGSTPKRNQSEFWNGDIPWVTPTDLPMPGRGIAEVFETAEYITESGLASCSASLLPVGTVLFSSRATIGKLGIAQIPITTNQGFVNFIPKPCLYNRYLAFALQHYTPQITLLAGSTTFKEISRGSIRKFKLPLPPLSEQHRIVEILDQADALRKRRAEADAKVERILPALFTKMFDDSVINTMKWHRVPLNKLLRKKTGALQSGPFGSNLHNSDFFEEGTVLAVGIDNVNDSGFQIGRNRRITLEKYKELEKYRLEPGDVLISIMGTIGRTCVFPEWAGKAICTKHVYRVQTELESLTPEYLSMSIRFSPTLKAQLGASTTGQIVKGITSKALKELIVDVPPLNLQKQFVQIKTLIDKNFIGCSKSRLELERLFDGLLNRAFSGELTSKWREAHMIEILAEMEQQTKILGTTAELHYEQLALIETRKHLT